MSCHALGNLRYTHVKNPAGTGIVHALGPDLILGETDAVLAIYGSSMAAAAVVVLVAKYQAFYEETLKKHLHGFLGLNASPSSFR